MTCNITYGEEELEIDVYNDPDAGGVIKDVVLLHKKQSTVDKKQSTVDS